MNPARFTLTHPHLCFQIRHIGHFLKVWKGDKTSLPFKEWESVEEALDWEQVLKDIETREISKYGLHVQLIEKFKHKTQWVLDTFNELVLEKNFDHSEADVILSTIHAAKGMEWDRVQVVDHALTGLVNFDVKLPGMPSSFTSPGKDHPWDECVEFNFKNWGDELNLWYVALTRARKVLSVPPKFMALLTAFDILQVYATYSDDGQQAPCLAFGDELNEAIRRQDGLMLPDYAGGHSGRFGHDECRALFAQLVKLWFDDSKPDSTAEAAQRLLWHLLKSFK